MTSEEFNAKIAIFASRETAQQAANGAMRRRKHNRPYVQPSGYHSAKAGHEIYIVLVPHANIALMADGTMYDYQREATIRA